MDSNTVITKETKNKIRVDYEGKLSLKERLLNKLKSSHTWIKVVVNIFRFIMMLGVSFVIIPRPCAFRTGEHQELICK